MQKDISTALITAFEKHYDTSWDDAQLRNERLAWRAAWDAAQAAPAAVAPLPAVLEQIAQGWDGCKYDAPGEMLDIGADIRATVKRLLAEQPAAVAGPALVSIPHELLVRAVNSLGAFVSEHGWAQTDMDTLDDLCAAMPDADLAAAQNLSAAAPALEAPAAPTQGLAIPDDCPHIIWFDDHEMQPVMFAGHGARAAALEKFKRISLQWNAHLFVRIDRNSQDDRFSVAVLAAAPQAPAQEVAHRLLRRNGRGEWVHDAKFWAHGPAPAELVADVSEHPDLWRIEHAYSHAAPQAPAAPLPVDWPVARDALQRWAQFADQATRMGLSHMHNNMETLAEELTKLSAMAPVAAPAAPAVDALAKGEVVVEVHGLTGSGKSALCGEIEIMCRALGLEVAWPGGESEKRMTHAEWTDALELYKPRVRIVERNHAAQAAAKGAAS